MEYFIRHVNSSTDPIQKEDATPFTYENISLFAHKYNNVYRVTEKSTGCQIPDSDAPTKEEAIELSKKIIDKFTVPVIKKHIENALIANAPKILVNLEEL